MYNETLKILNFQIAVGDSRLASGAGSDFCVHAHLHKHLCLGLPTACLDAVASKLGVDSLSLATRLGFEKNPEETLLHPGLSSVLFVVASFIDKLASKGAPASWLLIPHSGLKGNEPLDLLATHQGRQYATVALSRIS